MFNFWKLVTWKVIIWIEIWSERRHIFYCQELYDIVIISMEMEHSCKIWLCIRIFALDFSAVTASLSAVTACNGVSGVHMTNASLQGHATDAAPKSAVMLYSSSPCSCCILYHTFPDRKTVSALLISYESESKLSLTKVICIAISQVSGILCLSLVIYLCTNTLLW